MKTEEEFEEIIREAIERAEAVECDFAEFVNGLQIMFLVLQERLGAAKQEQRGRR